MVECSKIATNSTDGSASARVNGSSNPTAHQRTVFTTSLQLAAPFLNIRDALTLRETSRWLNQVVNSMPLNAVGAEVPIGLAMKCLRGSVGLRL